MAAIKIEVKGYEDGDCHILVTLPCGSRARLPHKEVDRLVSDLWRAEGDVKCEIERVARLRKQMECDAYDLSRQSWADHDARLDAELEGG